jgi:RNA polymerase sigma-70 factor, ECF subfamily
MNLVYYERKSIEEVAFVGVPTNTVKTRMFDARHQLAELLREAGVKGFGCAARNASDTYS